MIGPRVPGHTLVAEGAAHVWGVEVRQWVRAKWNTVSGEGRGLCSCGTAGPVVTSAHQRKKWHREHKAQVIA